MRQKTMILSLVLCLCLAAEGYSGGWDNSLIGARPAGMAAAFVGLANDANAIFYNPAGLSFTETTGELLICGKKYFPIHTYISPAGQKGTSENPASMLELFTYFRLNPKLSFGLGVYTPYAGGGIRWKKEEVGLDLEGDIGVVAFSPTFAYKISEFLSIGVNINGYYIVTHQKYGQGQSSFNAEETDFAVSYSGSIFLKPDRKWSFGLTYHGPSDVKLKGNSHVGELKADSETKFYLPFSLFFGIAYKFSQRLTIVGEYDFFRWSKLQSLKKYINFPDPLPDVNYEEKLGFKDSYYLKIGGEYDLCEKMAMQLGFSYDKGAVPNESLSLTNIDVDKINFTGGLTYRWGAYDLNVAGFISSGKEQTVPINENLSMSGSNFNLEARGILISVNRVF